MEQIIGFKWMCPSSWNTFLPAILFFAIPELIQSDTWPFRIWKCTIYCAIVLRYSRQHDSRGLIIKTTTTKTKNKNKNKQINKQKQKTLPLVYICRGYCFMTTTLLQRFWCSIKWQVRTEHCVCAYCQVRNDSHCLH